MSSSVIVLTGHTRTFGLPDFSAMLISASMSLFSFLVFTLLLWILSVYVTRTIMARQRSIVHLDDDAHLAQLGHKAELKRHFSTCYAGLGFCYPEFMDCSRGFFVSGFAFWRINVSNMGTYHCRDLQYVPCGVFGRILECLPYRWRTVPLGRYDFLEKWVPLLSWITGWINVSGWIALVASGGLWEASLLLASSRL